MTYFHNKIENLINNTFDTTTFNFTYVNIGAATTYGTESFASVAVNDALKLRADYTTIVTRDDTTGLGLRNRPGHKESLTAIWTPTAQVTLSASVLYVGHAVEFNRDERFRAWIRTLTRWSISRAIIKSTSTLPSSGASTTCSTGITRARSASISPGSASMAGFG